ncbi:FKBP-type peptidyl-prolyl cis-trans isomerase N-terminal domain-containing protein [Edwardsiella anguillarum]|uniref:FKBP-type peptidyl-prolyl cis-trans isomerase N-terminal domain-containing protein n=1 Tax=Edwardsiella anguillarum TaxID=1821960 RepID=UPI0024B63F28|nr:FKBP-type peptidyl-prolyl cis-trans isomerase N-terminal domain-containing protein [Edwardsiella anguillarum]WHP79126.1 FKBP-type peptidyl-prolyl cis-trans isomerase [Edwardsiella anguillarum]WHQ16584.1 FKBP-type peptidyl-prolyl cis-trans isomerase [Edwardsiella anguillarum]WHQ20119.1 FKBP-type peptidyl-prolyl cis-trans isomerase [Edwardsiella anguillarum]WHQ23640.1 FKBP-type peptidyl-prolyl cis-trans isomerase [Edwardsiella anguillarum]WHQ27211.1 FKBP-type peptidyl-prolyl cis-trans isomera
MMDFFFGDMQKIIIRVVLILLFPQVSIAESDNGASAVLCYAQQYLEQQSSSLIDKLNDKIGDEVDHGSGKQGEQSMLSGRSSGLLSANIVRQQRLILERQLKQLQLDKQTQQEQLLELSKKLESANILKTQLDSLQNQLKSQSEDFQQKLNTLADISALDKIELVKLQQAISRFESEGIKQGELIGGQNSIIKQVESDNRELKASLSLIENEMKNVPTLNVGSLDKEDVRQNYASGVMIGRDIQTSQTMLGINVDNRILLAGVRDALNHQVKINEKMLSDSLASIESNVNKMRLSMINVNKKAGADYLSSFEKRKGVQKDKSGFWYVIDHSGDGDLIGDGHSVVDLVVTEKLIDGTVIEDMDAKGSVISQPLDEYPRLFQSALRLMKNHSSMTLVVPSEMAYGDDGYAPKVPPGATMVYTLRVENIK